MTPRPNPDARRTIREEPIRALPSEGQLQFADGRRAAVLPALFLRHLAAELAQPLSDHSRHALYKFGYEWALQDMVRLSAALAAEFGGGANLDLWQMDARFVLDRWWAPLAASGWGACTLDLAAHSKGFAFVELRHSLAAPSASGATQPVCHLYAGLFGGAFSFFDRIERHSVEIECVALGAPSCRFVVGPGPQVDEVESWRQQRIAPDEIRRRLQ